MLKVRLLHSPHNIEGFIDLPRQDFENMRADDQRNLVINAYFNKQAAMVLVKAPDQLVFDGADFRVEILAEY